MPSQSFSLQALAQFYYPLHRIQHVSDARVITIKRRIGHIGTASLQTRCAKPSECGSVREETRSTLLPSNFSHAEDIARSLRQLYSPGIHFTRKSTSLFGCSSLRAQEPKTQSFSALCFFAIAYISSRFARISSSIHILSCPSPGSPPLSRFPARRRQYFTKTAARKSSAAAERRSGVSETNPDKHGSWTLSATRDLRRGECLVTAYCRNALPCAIPDCRDRTPLPQRRRRTMQNYALKSSAVGNVSVPLCLCVKTFYGLITT